MRWINKYITNVLKIHFKKILCVKQSAQSYKSEVFYQFFRQITWTAFIYVRKHHDRGAEVFLQPSTLKQISLQPLLLPPTKPKIKGKSEHRGFYLCDWSCKYHVNKRKIKFLRMNFTCLSLPSFLIAGLPKCLWFIFLKVVVFLLLTSKITSLTEMKLVSSTHVSHRTQEELKICLMSKIENFYTVKG